MQANKLEGLLQMGGGLDVEASCKPTKTKAAAPEAPEETPTEVTQDSSTYGGNPNDEFDPYDPKLMAEILKHNAKMQNPKAAPQAPKPKGAIAKVANPVDMDKLDKLFKIAHNLPKIELHAHIGGCYRPQTFVELAEAKNISIDHIDFYNVDLKAAFEIFKVGSQLITDTATLKRVTKEIIEDYNKQNTRYLELRSTPKAIGEIKTKEEYVETVLEAIQEASEEFRSIRVAFLISVNRTAEVATAKEAVDLLVKF